MINVSPEEYARLLQKTFCTPDDFEKAMDYHRCVLDAWLKQQDRTLTPTRPALQKLVNLIYHASLVPDERRFPHFSVCVPSRPPRPDAMVMQFQPIPVKTVDDLRKLAPAHSVPAVRGWFSSMGRQMEERWIRSKDPTKPGPWFDGQFRDAATQTATQFVSFFWSSMLDAAVDLQHGGMFVVLDNPATAPMKPKYVACCTEPQNEVFDYFAAAMDARVYGMPGESRLMERWQRLTSSFSSLAYLSSVDGGVVFDRYMTLYSFGSEIRVNEHEISTLGRTLVEETSGPEIPESQVMSYGTRHRSAIRLCQAVEGALVFVVSQDGDLRIFHSDSSQVHRWDNLNAMNYPENW